MAIQKLLPCTLLISTLFLSASPLFSLTSFSEMSSYPEFCIQASQDPVIFSNFKSTPVYSEVLEHVTYEQGKEYLDIILREAPEFKEQGKFDIFRENDSLGNPVVYSYENIGSFSPTTLRYIKVALDLKKQFGSLDNLNIVEIGGGYGGQCFILSKLFKFKSYTIIDLPGALALTQKYLSTLGVTNVSYVKPDEVRPNQMYDLAISNYAFSECATTLQEEYLKKVLYKSTMGYLTCNYMELAEITVLTNEELKNKLCSAKIMPQELPETPSTAVGNYIIVWAGNS